MKIAMIGQRGIPALFGGPERHVEELAVRMAELGHQVTVYTRPSYTDPALRSYRGVHLCSLPSIATKHLDAITHTILCTFHALGSRADVFHYHAEGPGLLSWVPKLAGRKVVVTLHGQDWRREKWGWLARCVLRLGERVSARLPDATICVSETLAQDITRAYGRRSDFIPNGVALNTGSDDTLLRQHGLEPGRYVLFAARLVPEKGCHYLLDAWRQEGFEIPLVVTGDSGFSDDYVEQLKAQAPNGVVFTGWVYGAQLASLFRSAALFVLPSDIEGMPIALLESLGYGTPVLASNIAEIREVLGSWGTTFVAGSVDDLRIRLRECLDDLPARKAIALRARDAVVRDYDWDVTVGRLVAVYERLQSSPRPPAE